jgi:hypothetical protein
MAEEKATIEKVAADEAANEKAKNRKSKVVPLRLPVKICASLFAVLVLGLHVFGKNDRVDGTAALLLAIAILPWLSDLLDTLELPGGWKLHFRDIEEEQAKQRKQLEQLQLATRLLLTDAEMKHLKNFAGTGAMPLHRDYTTQFYEKELRRLKALGLIEGSVGDFFRRGDDARAHLKITKEGRQYLEFRAEQIKDVDAAA